MDELPATAPAPAPSDAWELDAMRHEDGSAYIEFKYGETGIGVTLDSAQREELVRVLSAPEGRGFYRSGRDGK